jgi:hypothetical protein
LIKTRESMALAAGSKAIYLLNGVAVRFEVAVVLCLLADVIGAFKEGETGMRCGAIRPYTAAAPATVSGIRDPNATGLALQAREGGSRDHREPGDRPLTGI